MSKYILSFDEVPQFGQYYSINFSIHVSGAKEFGYTTRGLGDTTQSNLVAQIGVATEAILAEFARYRYCCH